MKKSLLFALAAGTVILSLNGCGNTNVVEEDVIISEETAEEEMMYYVSVEAIGFDNALLNVTFADEEGGTYVEETGSYGWMGNEGMTIAQMMEEWNVISMEAVCEGQEFLGWIAKEQVVEVDENGFEEYSSVKLYDGKIFTTEEMMAQELPAGDITFYSVWDLICGGCEEAKICEIYYIDDGIYYVCDDCYEEFAHGIGLE